MNALDVMKYGNGTLLQTLRGLPEEDWQTAGVCGWWSVREIIAHLASYEQMLLDVLAVAAGKTSGAAGKTSGAAGQPDLGPTLRAWLRDGQAFNDEQVPARAALSPAETLAEYETTHDQAMGLASSLDRADFVRPGFLPQYGRQYDLEDFITYTFYGHKREHSAQIAVFRDAIKR